MENITDQQIPVTQPMVSPVSLVQKPNPSEPKKPSKLLIFSVILAVLAFAWYFLFNPFITDGSPNIVEPFTLKQLVLSERISYLIHEPQVGDGVIFSNTTQANSALSWIGIIVNTKNDNNIRTYEVVSTKNQTTPWVMTRDKITAKIYSPRVKHENLLAIATPAPSPALDPTLGWETYTNPVYLFSFKHPATSTDEPNPTTGSKLTLVFHKLTNNPGSEMWIYVGDKFVFNHSTTDQGSSIQINGLDAKRWDLPMGQNPAQTIVELQHVDDKITIQLIKDSNDTEIQKVFEQILSTFNFTNIGENTQNLSQQIPGWKYYVKSDYSLQYPADQMQVFEQINDTTPLKGEEEFNIGYPNTDSIALWMYRYKSTLSAPDWWNQVGSKKYNQLVHEFVQSSEPQPSITLPQFITSTKTFAGESAVVAEGYVNSPQRGDTTVTVVSHQGYIYMFEQSNQDWSSKLHEISNKILETFRFAR